MSNGLKERLVRAALQSGLDDVRVCAPYDILDGGRFARWLARGRHGDMAFLERHLDQRLSPQRFFAGVRSMLLAVKSYRPDSLDCGGETQAGVPIALYARGRDYHRVVKKPLKGLAKMLIEAGYDARVHVDTAPVMEKVLGVRSGLGVQGRNSLLIHPRLGSFVFLGGIATSALLEPDDGLAEGDGPCAGCNRCVEACPTGALDGKGGLDARRCLSWASIECKEGMSEALAALAGGRVYGCDICQLVCPANAACAVGTWGDFAPFHGAETMSPKELSLLDADQFAQLFRGSAVRRIGWQRFVGNSKRVSGTA